MASLKDVAGVLIPGGFGERGVEGKIQAARFARENNVPYLGLCLGMQVATIEFARNVCGLEQANSTEFDKNTPDPVISLLEEQRDVSRQGREHAPRHVADQDRAGHAGRRASTASNEALERHRHRYEFNMKYREQMTRKGLHDFRHFTRRRPRGIDRARATTRTSSPASITRNSRASRTSRTRFSKALSKPASRTKADGARRNLAHRTVRFPIVASLHPHVRLMCCCRANISAKWQIHPRKKRRRRPGRNSRPRF